MRMRHFLARLPGGHGVQRLALRFCRLTRGTRSWTCLLHALTH